MIKILQLCNKAPFPPNDGSSIAIYNMSKGLISQGVELHLHTLNTVKHHKPENQIPQDYLTDTNYYSYNINTNPSVFGALFTLFSKKSYFVTRFYNKEFENHLVDFLKNNKIDIVQLEGLFMGTYISSIKKYSDAKIVLRAHNIEHKIWERHIYQSKSFFKRWYLKIENNKLKKYELKAFNDVDAIVPITPKDAYLISNLCKVPIHTALTGTDIKEYTNVKREDFDPCSIFHFGSMDWIPNQEAVDWFLTNCWSVIKNKIPKARFVIAGRNIPKRFKELNDEAVLIEENVPNSIDIYSKYNVMIIPVLSGSGLRIKIIEGFCFGKAMVSTSIGAEGIDCHPDNDIVISDSPEKFSQSIIELLQNKNKCAELEQNARIFAKEKLNSIPISQKLVAFYENLTRK